MEIKDKVIVVTGASQGIGRSLAQKLAHGGAQVVLAARSTDALSALEKDLPGTRAIPTDMRSPESIRELIEKTVALFGRIDILVNNAGQGMYGPVEHIDIDGYKSIMELNVYGPLRAMELVIPRMRAHGGGMIVNVSSKVSKNYFPHLAAYASTKYALNALSLTARQELAADGIIVSVMHPKMTATDFGKNAIGARPDFATRRPAMDVDTPDQVADVIIGLIRSELPEAEM